ncbi:MAG: glycosyltransferase family 39 protein [Chloroflexi bacterium]|nr:glycosyltransferase family 39 protein [Chloroflexota bacterium]
MNKTPRHLFSAKLAFPLILALLLGLGAFLRFSDLSAPLLDFHPTRQLFSAIKARGLYFQSLPDAPAWQKDLALRQYSGEATIEPPLVEHLAVFFYARFGEQTAFPRAASGLFWLIGAIFLFWLSKNLTGSSNAALFSLAFYLLLPYGITASRAFQPDPLMVMFIIIFWWSVEHWSRRPSWGWTLISGLSGGLAILVKFPAAFFVIGAALAAILAHLGFVKSLKLPQTWALAVLGVLPPAAYLYYGLYVDGSLRQQFGGRFYPELWISPFFYLRWFLKLENVVNILWIALALFGWLVFASKPAKTFLSGLWIAYLIFGLTFAHHISSHDYYSLPFIPIAALSIAPLAGAFLPVFLKKIRSVRSLQLLVLVLILLTLSFYSIDQYLARRANDYRPQAAFWAQVGETIGHQPGSVALTTDYGYPLAYYGWQNADPWPLAPDIQDFDEVFSRLRQGKSYFLVTDFDEYERQPELQKRLNEKFPVLAQGRGFIVFDLYHPKQ